MPIMPLNVLTEEVSIAELCNEVAKLQKMVNYLTGGQLDFDNIRVKGIVADNIDVSELSAINANLGHITAGLIESVEIFGSYIATRNGTYPRAEMSNTDDLFGAYASVAKYIRMVALNGSTSAPTMVMFDGTAGITGLIYLDNILNELSINSTDNIQISALPGGDVKLNGNNVTVNGVNVNSGLGSNMAFDPATRNLKLFAPNGNTIATVNIP